MELVMRPLKATMQALGLRLFAPHREGAVDPADADLGTDFFEYISDMDTGMWIGLHALVVLFNLLPLFIIGKFSTFRGLSPEDQDRYIYGLAHSRIYPLQLVMVSLRMMLSLVFFDRDECLIESGWGLNLVSDKEGGK